MSWECKVGTPNMLAVAQEQAPRQYTGFLQRLNMIKLITVRPHKSLFFSLFAQVTVTSVKIRLVCGCSWVGAQSWPLHWMTRTYFSLPYRWLKLMAKSSCAVALLGVSGLSFHIGSGASCSFGDFWGDIFGFPWLTLITFHLTGRAGPPSAMSVLECLKWQNFVDTSDDFANTEGKSGVPRFDGEASRLAEYCFRVRLLDTKIKNMDATEAKKLGPLGIRLVEGLRSQALQVAGEIPMDKLASADGPNILLEFLQKAFRPRRLQEARELYTAGAQQYGLLARQPGEPMPSFLLRRRTWQRMLKDLDPDLQVPEGILAEQTLLCSGISHEQRKALAMQ